MAKYNIYLYNFNNYANRVEKTLPEISDYNNYLVCNPMTNINFNPNDGINAIVIVNTYDKTYYKGEPNYCIIEDMDTTEFTRWFVMETVYERNGQMRINLKRDVIADNFDIVLDAPCFIEKGTVPDTNPLIYNSEDMNFNQIKKGEVLLFDDTHVPWIVGYVAQKDGQGNVPTWKGTVTKEANYDILISNKTHENWDYGQYSRSNPYYGDPQNQIKYEIYFYPNRVKIGFTQLGRKSKVNWNLNIAQGYNITQNNEINIIYNSNYPDWYNRTTLKNQLITLESLHTQDDMQDFLKYDGKTVKFSDGIFHLTLNSTNITKIEAIDNNSGAIYTSLKNTTDTHLQTLLGRVPYSVEPVFEITYDVPSYWYSYEKADDAASYDYEISANRNHLNQVPYDIFAIPCGRLKINNGDTSFFTAVDIPYMIAANIPIVGSANLYDIQLVPYCPFQSLIASNNTLDISSIMEGKDYSFITTTTGNAKTNTGIILYPKNNSFDFKINLSDPIVITEPKIESECDMYRLCSPNYSGVFEFNAAKNGGISTFDVSCTYIPFSPFIHINPIFNLLYGTNFNDNRGLICSGEFSLSIVNDKWIDYQLQNKNYEKSFQRNIESLELQNKYGLIQDISGAIAGTVQGTAAGGFVGGPTGAVLGGIASGLGGVADVAINQSLRRENINLQKDQFNYQLGNIKALPNTLSRTSTFNSINKKFPFLEYYTCTLEEREILRNKIKYEGMTIMAIGTIRDYIIGGEVSFIKGKIIRINNSSFYGDSHLLDEIYTRIIQGVYIEL